VNFKYKVRVYEKVNFIDFFVFFNQESCNFYN